VHWTQPAAKRAFDALVGWPLFSNPDGFSFEPWRDRRRQMNTGGLHCPVLIQRRLALFSLAALCVRGGRPPQLAAASSIHQVLVENEPLALAQEVEPPDQFARR
jgi:hypothetical protein